MMNLNLKWFGVSAGYKRAEQDFKSLGVPYAINDLEMITASAKTSLFKNKLSINLSGNSQENNLSNNRSSTIQSRTGNANFNALLNKKLNTNLNITAVNIYQKDGLMELTDSTRMNQLMLAFNLSPSYNFGGNVYQNSIGANVSYTNLNDKNLLSREYTNGENISTSVNYNLSMNKIDASFFSMLSYSVYKQTAGGYKSTGLTLGANKSFLEKKNFSTNGSIGYFFNSSDFSDASNNLTFALGSSYNYKKHNFGLSSSYTYTPPINLNPLNTINIYRIPYAVNSKIFTASINYSYHF